MRSKALAKLLLLWRNDKGVSALEFSILAPVLIILILGGVDIARYTIAVRRITSVSSTIGQMLSVNSNGTVAWTDLQFYHDSAMVLFPQVLADAKQQGLAWSNDIAITMSSVTFTPTLPTCTTNCIYLPKVTWSSGTNQRSCLVPPTSSPNTAAPTSRTLPADVFGPASVLVIDVAFTFHPMVAQKIIGNLPITRSYYVSPRYVPKVTYTLASGDNGMTTVCL